MPEAVASTYYAMPALKHLGIGLVSRMATKRGFSVYPYGSAPLARFVAAHPEYERTKGSIHVTASAPMPIGDFDELIAIRLQDLQHRKNP